MNERGAASRICGHPYGCERVELRKTTAVRVQQSEHMIILRMSRDVGRSVRLNEVMTWRECAMQVMSSPCNFDRTFV